MRFDTLDNFQVGDAVRIKRSGENETRYQRAIYNGHARVRATMPWRLEWFAPDGTSLDTVGSLVAPKRLEHVPWPEHPGNPQARSNMRTRLAEAREAFNRASDEFGKAMGPKNAESDSESLSRERLTKYAQADSEALRSLEKSVESLSRGDALAMGDRMQEYGSPKVSFDRIAAMWSAYLSAPEVDPENLTGEDVGHLMIALKLSRSITDKKPDTLDDLEGYVSCIRMIRDDG